MKRLFIIAMMALTCVPYVNAQIYKTEGYCGTDTKWTFDGYTLVISNDNDKGQPVAIREYNMEKQLAPWTKARLDVRKVEIQRGVTRIGSCAFANCQNLQEVVFTGTDLVEIGWGAFLNCTRLRNISLPVQVRLIETIAFANCNSLASVTIPDQCRVGDQAFVSCDNLKSIEMSPTAIIGHHAFASEVNINNKVRHAMYSGEIIRLPAYINPDNSHEYGLSSAAVEKITKNRIQEIDYDYQTSSVDKLEVTSNITRNNTYALIIGNQNYRFASDVPYAIHDARVFGDYCKKVLGIPAGNIHIAEDATKQMIMEEELEDWVKSINNRDEKKLIVYYAGHGVPDVKNKNKAYILPTDVRGTNPKRGIALDEFYAKLGELEFNQTTIFLDACFSGVNRSNEGVTEGLRAVEIDAEDTELGGGSLVVFSAAQGNETAQGYPEQGHGLFTYYLLDALQKTNGVISFGELSDHIKDNVSNQARELKMHKKQTPTTIISDKIANAWRNFSF